MQYITACTLDCPDCCSLIVETGDAGSFRIRGNPDHPVTRGFICAKVKKKYPGRLRSRERIIHPILRTKSGWEKISWERALRICAETIAQCRREPASILYFHGEGGKGVLKQAGHRFFTELGATRVEGSLCDTAGYLACVADFGSRRNPEPDDLLNASAVVLWGKDVKTSSIHQAALVSRTRWRGAKILSVSPGSDANASLADTRILIRPGTDRFLAAAVLKLFIERNAVHGGVHTAAAHWNDLAEILKTLSMDECIRSCDVSRDDVEHLFQAYARRGPVATIIGAGLQRYHRGGENVRFIDALVMASGHTGESGGGVYFHLNSLGNFNIDWSDKRTKEKNRFFRMPLIGRDIRDAAHPPVTMIWVEGSNMINQVPDSGASAEAFEGIGFKVVVDAFMTDTAARADLVLPAALMLEQEDIVGSFMHDYIHYVPKVFDPPGEARSDFSIFAEMGTLLDLPVLLPGLDECLAMSLASPHLDITLDELRQSGYARAKRPPVPYESMHFDHPDGKFRFVRELHAEPDPPPDYPLRLLTLVQRGAIHSQIMPDEQEMPPVVWISPRCPVLSSLDRGRDVHLVSPRGRLKVRVKTKDDLYPGVVVYRRGDWMGLGGGVNRLIAAGLTDIGMGAAFYDEYVRLENDPSPLLAENKKANTREGGSRQFWTTLKDRRS